MSYSRRTFLKIGGLSITATGFISSFLSSCGKKEERVLTNLVSGVKPLTEDDYSQRQQKARQFMAAHNMQGLFISPSSDLDYFTGVHWGRSERTFGAVLSLRGEPRWICPAFEESRAAERIPSGQKIFTWQEHESPYALMAWIMKDLGYRTGRMGLAPTVRHFVYDGLKKDAPSLRVVNGAAVTEGCRSRKDPKELDYMDLAAKITKFAYQEGFNKIHTGMSPADLAGAVRQAHGTMGVSGGAMVLFGPNAAYPHGTAAVRDLKEGDVILIDGGCSVEGYRSDISRTLVHGRPTDTQKKVWDIVRKAQKAVFAAVRPGITCGELDAVARGIIEEEEYGPGYTYFTHRLGHGIGLDGHEYPYLVRGNTLRLLPGMTFSNEPGIYIPGEFGVRLEDCFAVTQTGVRVLGEMEAESLETPFSRLEDVRRLLLKK